MVLATSDTKIANVKMSFFIAKNLGDKPTQKEALKA
jgi:hypothetical protein